MKLDYKLFKGVSVQLDNVEKAHEKAMKIASNPAVVNMWPVHAYDMPNPKVEWIGNPQESAPVLSRRADDGSVVNETMKDFSPHVMTQVDKLHEEGITGKGLRIAVIDTGVSKRYLDVRVVLF